MSEEEVLRALRGLGVDVDAHRGTMGELGLALVADSAVAESAIVSNACAAEPPRRVAFGYNHQIMHGGVIYHVQSEDSGRKRNHIFTHVFHAGVIVASARVDYGDAADTNDIGDLLRKSHKSMLRKLISGAFDASIGRCSDGLGALQVVPDPTPDEPSLVQKEREILGDILARLEKKIGTLDMDNIKQTLETIGREVAGSLAVALVDYESGMCLGTSGTGLNVDVAAAGNMEVMKAKARVMRDLGIKGGIEDILITLESQYHIIRPVGGALFFYLAIDREQGNLALARHKLATAAANVKV